MLFLRHRNLTRGPLFMKLLPDERVMTYPKRKFVVDEIGVIEAERS